MHENPIIFTFINLLLMNTRKLYNKYIYDIYSTLKQANKIEYDNTLERLTCSNNDLCKIFEYYTCIKLSENATDSNHPFCMYDYIDPDFKENHDMSRTDTGVDCSNLVDTIVQCKLRSKNITWRDCSTFFGSNIASENSELKIKWPKMILARNSDSTLSRALSQKADLFEDVEFSKDELIQYCENLYANPPVLPKKPTKKMVLRDYQIECINLIKNHNENIIVNIPTGTGKGVIIINCIEAGKKYLILVPTIILTEQFKAELIKFNPNFESRIQIIGDGNNVFNAKFSITICVYNSIEIVKNYKQFHKIFIDEAHHIHVPELYSLNELDENDLEDIDDDLDDVEDELIDSTDNKIEEESDTEYFIEEGQTEYAKYIPDGEITKDTEVKVKVKSFADRIRDLTKFNNNVYLSATIDKNKNMSYYTKDIREMIEKGYLCDYVLKIPVFNNDPTNKNICEYLIGNYRNIIIYCNSQEEGVTINNIMNELLPKCSEYIDCNTTRAKRTDIIRKYKLGSIPFLVNVRVLTEGFDAPITKGVCFMHLPKSDQTIIQIIGRALRIHPEKLFANIILPYSTDDDESAISAFLKTVARNDSRIRRSFEAKKFGGYINVINTLNETDDATNDAIDDVQFRCEMIFNSLGTLQNGKELWKIKFDKVVKHIDSHEERPSKSDKDKSVEKLGIWLYHQIENYRDRKRMFIDSEIVSIWETFINDDKYICYFEDDFDSFIRTVDKISKYIDINKKNPTTTDKNLKIRQLANRLDYYKKHYKSKTFIMKNPKVQQLWEEFTTKYNKYIKNNNNTKIINWKNILIKVKNFKMLNDNKCPTALTEPSLTRWLAHQRQSYKKNAGLMTDPEVKQLWEEFINN
jgi:superfamily II DNA or RNA helicase